MRIRRLNQVALLLAVVVALFLQLGPGNVGEGEPQAAASAVVLAEGAQDVPAVPHDDQPFAMAGVKPVKRPLAPTVLLAFLALLLLAFRVAGPVPRSHRTGPAAVTPGAVLLTRICVCRP